MNLRELFRRLSLGVLSNLSIGSNGSGDVIESGREKVVLHANTALKALHTRFRLREKSLMVQTIEGKTRYPLLPQYSVTNAPRSGEEYPYILDTVAEPLEDDVIRVIDVLNENGVDLPLNDRTHCDSLFTPSNNVLEIPASFTGEFFSVTYQAFAPKIVYQTDFADTHLVTEIYIPAVLEDAFLNYIGHLVYSNMNTQESLMQAQKLMQMYENAVSEIQQKDLLGVSNSATNIKFYDRGWK